MAMRLQGMVKQLLAQNQWYKNILAGVLEARKYHIMQGVIRVYLLRIMFLG
jgi:hypothetical protein